MGTEKYIKNYIDGALAPAHSGDYLDNVNPATGKVYSYLPDSDDEDVQRAVEAAERVAQTWAGMEAQKRFRILMRMADIIEQNMELYARAETVDSGKPLSMSKSVDIPRSQANFRFFASAIMHLESQAFHLPGEAVHFTMRQPIGIVGCLSPWNLPLYLLSHKIAAALAVGNCVIARPSELTPMTAFLLSKAAIDSGLPPGVLNIVHGSFERTGQAIVEHPKIRALAFSGETATGQMIAQQTAGMVKKLSLELGAKNANIIFADCHFDQMMVDTLRSSFSNNGQISHCASRIYVERSLYEKFREEIVKRTAFLKVGDPSSAVTDLGALISQDHLDRVLSYIALAEVEGGTVLCGGKRIEMQGDLEGGYFLRPAVIEGLPLECRTNQEEIFGPIVTIAPFDTEEEAIELANGTSFGLSATVWTKNVARATRVAEKLRCGMVWINSWMVQDPRPPLDRILRSGYRREGGLETLHFFTDAKTVCIKY